jgi:hypothetical protein
VRRTWNVSLPRRLLATVDGARWTQIKRSTIMAPQTLDPTTGNFVGETVYGSSLKTSA